MTQFNNASEAVDTVRGNAIEGEVLNLPSNVLSSYIGIFPPRIFDGSQSPAEVAIELDGSIGSTGVSIYRANMENVWIFTELDSRVENGRVMASTNQGGVFVAGSPVDYGLVIGLVIAALVLLVLAMLTVGVVIYFVVHRDKWDSTKKSISKAKMNLKRSFAKQV